jgi:hypothetical protein
MPALVGPQLLGRPDVPVGDLSFLGGDECVPGVGEPLPPGAQGECDGGEHHTGQNADAAERSMPVLAFLIA